MKTNRRVLQIAKNRETYLLKPPQFKVLAILVCLFAAIPATLNGLLE